MSSCAFRCPAAGLRGSISLPGDKSIAHRAVMLSALACGTTRVENFPRHNDSQATVNILRQMGVPIAAGRQGRAEIIVSGRGLLGLRPAEAPLQAHESGTTLRLFAGILSGQPFASVLTADPGLSRRPMSRITLPLRKMGARIKARRLPGTSEEFPPLAIDGGLIRPITYRLPVASAQVKSALLLAGLYAPGKTMIIEPSATRDHTERMLRMFGVRVSSSGRRVCLQPPEKLVSCGRLIIPGDISSAAFFIVAGLIVPHSRLLLKNVSLNPTRCGLISVLKQMGGRIGITNRRNKAFEPAGDILVESSRLAAVKVPSRLIPSLIDEVPILMVAASLARGTTVLEGVQELRVKETDRLVSMTANLKNMGVRTRVSSRGKSVRLSVEGVSGLTGGRVDGFNDHRTAMSMAVAGLAASGTTVVSGVECIDKSFPGFLGLLRSLQ